MSLLKVTWLLILYFIMLKEINVFHKPKPYTTYDEQINIFRDRNLIIRNTSLARHYLSEYSYYNLSNGIGTHYLIRKHPNVFKQGISLNYLVKLQTFDQEVRSVLFPQILNIEVSLNTKLSHLIGGKSFGETAIGNNGYLSEKYYISNSYRTLKNLKRSAFYDVQVDKDSEDMSTSDIETLIKEYQSKWHTYISTPLKHYLLYHKNVPAWILVKNLTFGSTAHWYKILYPKDKFKIIKRMLHLWDFKGIQPNFLINLINNCLSILVKFRNACAHGDVISQIQILIKDRHVNYAKLFSKMFLGYFDSNNYLIKKSDYKKTREYHVNSYGKKIKSYYVIYNLYSCILSIILLTDDRKQLSDFLRNIKIILYKKEQLNIDLDMPANSYERIKRFINNELYY